MSFGKRDRSKEAPKLTECGRCHYVACICLVLRHAESCPWRIAILDTKPELCAPHEVIACDKCNPCNCGGPQVKTRRRAP